LPAWLDLLPLRTECRYLFVVNRSHESAVFTRVQHVTKHCEVTMKPGPITIASLTFASALLAGGLGAGLGLASPASAAVVPAAAHGTTFVVLDCNAKPEVKPGTIILTCADDGIGLKDLHWTRWTSHGAAGYGTFWENLCVPNCADGHIEQMPARVTLRGSAAVKGHRGDRQYTLLTAVFPHKRPTVYKLEHGKLVVTHPKSWTFHI
jgi:hypothetical protein